MNQQTEPFEEYLISKYRKNYLDIIIEKYVNTNDPTYVIDTRTFTVIGHAGKTAHTIPEFGAMNEYYCKPAQKLIKRRSKEIVCPKKSKNEKENKKTRYAATHPMKRGKGKACSMSKSNKKQKRHIPLNTSVGSKRFVCSESITSDDDLTDNRVKGITIDCLSVLQNTSDIISVESKPLGKSLNVTNSHLCMSKKLEENFIVDGIPKSGKNGSINSSIAYDDFIMKNFCGIKFHCRVPLYNFDIKQFNEGIVKLGSDGKPLLKSVNRAENAFSTLTYFNPTLNESDGSENKSAVPSKNIRPQDELFSDADLSNPDSKKHTSKELLSVRRKRIRKDTSPAGNSNVAYFSGMYDNVLYEGKVKLGSKGKPLLKSVNKAENSSLPLSYITTSLNEFDGSENKSAVPSKNIRPQDKLLADVDLSNPDSNKDIPKELVSVHHKRFKKDMSPAGNSDNALANFLRKYTKTPLDKIMKCY